MRPKGSICHDCAKLQGLAPKDKAVGIWIEKCDFCGETRGLTDAVHDWHHPSDRRITLEELAAMIGIKEGETAKEAPSG